jgi:hypothetical protein
MPMCKTLAALSTCLYAKCGNVTRTQARALCLGQHAVPMQLQAYMCQ